MHPTDADYEKLARTVCLAQDDDPDTICTTLAGECAEWELLTIGEGNDCVSTTRDTLDDFRRNSQHWREPGRMEEVNGGLYWAECQASKGHRRCELCVIDCGEFRLIYQC